MPHYISNINRVKLLFIKTTLSKFNYIAAENLILYSTTMALRPQHKQLK